MVEHSKMNTISVRVEEKLSNQFEAVANIIQINKSDFIRSCLQKLCEDNKVVLDHYDKVPEYLSFVKGELSKLPQDLIVVKNGSLKDVRESTLFLLFDEFWKTSPIVFDIWQKFIEEYDLTNTRVEAISDFSEAKESDGLLGLDSIIMLMAEKSGQVEQVDIPLLLSSQGWVDGVEIDRISLSYACKKAFEKVSARTIVDDFLNAERVKKGCGHLRVVIDASGNFRRSGSILYLPVDTEEREKK